MFCARSSSSVQRWHLAYGTDLRFKFLLELTALQQRIQMLGLFEALLCDGILCRSPACLAQDFTTRIVGTSAIDVFPEFKSFVNCSRLLPSLKTECDDYVSSKYPEYRTALLLPPCSSPLELAAVRLSSLLVAEDSPIHTSRL